MSTVGNAVVDVKTIDPRTRTFADFPGFLANSLTLKNNNKVTTGAGTGAGTAGAADGAVNM